MRNEASAEYTETTTIFGKDPKVRDGEVES